MHKIFRKFRVLLSVPFVAVAIAMMGIATWIIPKPEHVKRKDNHHA